LGDRPKTFALLAPLQDIRFEGFNCPFGVGHVS